MLNKETREYLRDDDITINRVEQLLKTISDQIKNNNKLNLTDINVICENIFASILNQLFDCKLTALTTEVSSTFAAVDLIDRDSKIAFQVTSTRNRGKITDTINGFIKHKLYEEFEELYILVLNIDPHKYQKQFDEINIYTSKTFTIKDNVIDFPKLISLISDKEKEQNGFVVGIYDDIKMVFDTGRLIPYNVLEIKDNFLTYYERHTTIGLEPYTIFRRGYGDVLVIAYIPETDKGECECLIEFRQISLSDVHITLSESELKNEYFVDEETFIKIHSVGRYKNDNNFWMQLGGARVYTNAHTAYHLYKIFNEIAEKYWSYHQRVLN